MAASTAYEKERENTISDSYVVGCWPEAKHELHTKKLSNELTFPWYVPANKMKMIEEKNRQT